MCAQSKPDADARLDKNVERRSETPLDCIRILINVVGAVLAGSRRVGWKDG